MRQFCMYESGRRGAGNCHSYRDHFADLASVVYVGERVDDHYERHRHLTRRTSVSGTWKSRIYLSMEPKSSKRHSFIFYLGLNQ